MTTSASRKSRRFSILLGLLLMATLASCNLLASNAPGTGETVISGQPVVRIAAPLPNATYLVSVPVNIQAQISNAGADISRVEFAVDNTIVATLDAPNAAGSAAFSVTESWQAGSAGQHSITVTAFRADGSNGTASVNVNVVEQSSVQTQATATQASGTNTQGGGDTSGGNNNQSGGSTTAPQPTNPPAQPTEPPPPTAVPPSATPSNPRATMNQGVNIRSGPSILFNPPIGSLAANDSADVLARTADSSWYKIRYYNGEGWVFGQLVSVSGDQSQIVIDAGPPPPTLTPTPIPVTNTPTSTVDLEIVNAVLVPAAPRINQTFQLEVTIRNNGTGQMTDGGLVGVQFFLDEDGCSGVGKGSQTASTQGAYGALAPGQQVTISRFPITIPVCNGFRHRGVFTVDSDNRLAETNESNNTFTRNVDKLAD